jgi:hypothetical protein
LIIHFVLEGYAFIEDQRLIMRDFLDEVAHFIILGVNGPNQAAHIADNAFRDFGDGLDVWDGVNCHFFPNLLQIIQWAVNWSRHHHAGFHIISIDHAAFSNALLNRK